MSDNLKIAGIRARTDQFTETVKNNDALMAALLDLHLLLTDYFDQEGDVNEVKRVPLTNLQLSLLGVCMGSYIAEGYGARGEK